MHITSEASSSWSIQFAVKERNILALAVPTTVDTLQQIRILHSFSDPEFHALIGGVELLPKSKVLRSKVGEKNVTALLLKQL